VLGGGRRLVAGHVARVVDEAKPYAAPHPRRECPPDPEAAARRYSIRRDVGTVRPARYAELVEAHAREHHRVAQRLEHRTEEAGREVDLAREPVGELDEESRVRPGFDATE
jgi:hypothetical protein